MEERTPRLAIIGSRDYADLAGVRAFVSRLRPTTLVVSGGARGVDAVAVDHARRCGLATEVIPADWELFGKSAGFRRNITLVDSVDGLVAFWDGTSRGTAHAISLARQAGLWLRVYSPDRTLFD